MVTMESTESPYWDQGWGVTVNFILESAPQLGMEGCLQLRGQPSKGKLASLAYGEERSLSS